MTKNYDISPTELADIPAIQEIYAHHVLHGIASFEEEPPSVEDMTQRFQAIMKKGQPYFKVKQSDTGEIVGYCYAGSFRERNAYRFTVETSLYLKPGFEGQGLGGLMLDTLIQACTERGYRQMVAVIGDSENHGSISTHKSRNFKHIGIMPATGFKHGRWIDTVLMQRDINGGSTTLPE